MTVLLTPIFTDSSRAGRQLLADSELPGEYHVFNLLHEQLRHGHRYYFIEPHICLPNADCLWSYQIPRFKFYLQDA